MAVLNRGNRDRLAALAGTAQQPGVQPVPQQNGRQQVMGQIGTVGQQFGLSAPLQGGVRRQLKQIYGAAMGPDAGPKPWKGMSNRDLLSGLAGLAPAGGGAVAEAGKPAVNVAGSTPLLATTGQNGLDLSQRIALAPAPGGTEQAVATTGQGTAIEQLQKRRAAVPQNVFGYKRRV